MYQVSIQSVNSFKSYRANKLKSTDRHTDRQTDTFAKTIFSGSEGLKTWTFDKNGEAQILHKSNTFSDENVIIYFIEYVEKYYNCLLLENNYYILKMSVFLQNIDCSTDYAGEASVFPPWLAFPGGLAGFE